MRKATILLIIAALALVAGCATICAIPGVSSLSVCAASRTETATPTPVAP